jgi:hypothetical protein
VVIVLSIAKAYNVVLVRGFMLFKPLWGRAA